MIPAVPPRGSTPDSVIRARLLVEFPRLVDYSITDGINPGYNCIGWTENPGWPRKIWPPRWYPNEDPLVVMDRFYASLGMTRGASLDVPIDKEFTVVALYGDAKGPQHAALRDAADPDWWESKLGDMWRVMHQLAQLEGGFYGDVVAIYSRRRP
jgi:hypothetical protein